MQVIPAIDLLDGHAVRLTRGDYAQVKVYDEDPAGLAARWRDQVERLHVVDLEGARQGQPAQQRLVASVVQAFGSGVEVGGGVRTLEAVSTYIDLGVERVVLGTAALKDPALVQRASERYPGRIIVAVDARNGMVATEGWLEQSKTPASDLLQGFAALPLAGVLYTDIERDGTEVGPNVSETARLAERCGLPVIASGGVGTLEHIRELAHSSDGIVGAIVGRALHEGRFSLQAAVAAAGLGSSEPAN
jgi:phosphoribosylformimino-5-aminoimidazole carboxamide ribotide isomerase